MIQSIEAIGVPSLVPTFQAEDVGSAAAPISTFGAVMDNALSQVNQNVMVAEGALQGLASGQHVEVHDVMIALEKAKISVQTLIQVRNRVLEAYQEIARMQV